MKTAIIFMLALVASAQGYGIKGGFQNFDYIQPSVGPKSGNYLPLQSSVQAVTSTPSVDKPSFSSVTQGPAIGDLSVTASPLASVTDMPVQTVSSSASLSLLSSAPLASSSAASVQAPLSVQTQSAVAAPIVHEDISANNNLHPVVASAPVKSSYVPRASYQLPLAHSYDQAFYSYYQPATSQPLSYQPIQYQPAQYQPAQYQPAQYQPLHYQPLMYRPPTEYNQVQFKPVEYKPIEYKPVEYKPVEYKPVQYKPVQTEFKPILEVSQSSVTKPIVESKPIEAPIKSLPISQSLQVL